MNIVEKLENPTNADEVKKVFIGIVKEYLSPAFGSMTKRDFEILLFMSLQKLGVIDENPEIFDIVSLLRVTRTKARNLLYEAKMRSATEEKLDEELKDLFLNPIFLKDNDKIAMEIGNPFLSDRLKAKLKKLGHITDGSFSPELIKLTVPAFVSVFVDMMPFETHKKVTDALIACGARKDTSLKGVLSEVLRKIGKKVAGEVGDQIGEEVAGFLEPIMTAGVGQIKKMFTGFFSDAPGVVETPTS